MGGKTAKRARRAQPAPSRATADLRSWAEVPAPEPAYPGGVAGQMLREVQQDHGRALDAQEKFSDTMARARRAGLSWQQLAEVTGINRETLRRRYGA